ncbi:MAG: UvrD-helicase domain-containing protein, partial [Acidobacteria bacterium]|nr:UvrD-helicase domain-containing protein [Acidobacteriota bacterium]
MQPSLFDAPDPNPAPRPDPDPIDQRERDFASDPSNHVVLEASAGTGKTKVLVDRYVNLIEAGVDPRNILAITFTRKAAAEMRDRVLTTMRARVETSKAMKERWRVLKDRVAEINISTIDAFCFGLLREFPLEADVDPAFEIADETEVPRFRAEAIELTLRACRETLIHDEPVRLLMAFKSTNQLRSALDRLLDARHVALSAVREFVARRDGQLDIASACRAFVHRVADLLARDADRDTLILRGPHLSPRFQRLAVDLTAIADGSFRATEPSDVRRLQRAVEWYFLTKAGEPRKRLADDAAKLFASDADKKANAAVMSALAPDVKGALEQLEQSVNAVLARGLLRVLEESVRQFDRLMAEHSVLDFPAMLDRAVRLLRRQEEFARSRLKLQSRYHHLLVDEFQDTSQAQWDLVTLLTEAWAEGEGVAGTRPSIFIVGDRKQSIYRFRHAEVTLMDEAAAFIGALRPGTTVRRAIQQSFRSVPELLGFVNAVSTEMRSDAEIAERFEYRDIDRFPGVTLTPGALRDGQPVLGVAVGASMVETANAVATEVQRLLEAKVPVRDRRGARPIEPEDIAILFRSRAGHRYYEDALEARGIKTYVYKGLGFFDAPEVQDLQALLRYLAQPESNLRAAALLRSRLIRLSDAALVALAPGLASALRSASCDVDAVLLSELDATLLRRARASVAAWLDAADRVPPADLVDRILDETAYAYELRGPRLSQARENVKKVRSLIRRVQNRGYATFARLSDYFRRLAAGEEANAVVAARGCVQLMTVHSAKGLEFPVVFLVRMNAGVGERAPAIGVVPKDGDGAPDVSISIASGAAKVERVRDQEESRRLLYVAMTRARDRLYFSAEIADEKKFNASNGFAKLLPAAMRRMLIAALPDRAGERVEWVTATNESFLFAVCPPDPQPPAVTREAQLSTGVVDATPIPSGDLERDAVTDVVLHTAEQFHEQGWTEASDRALGNLVHRLFQHRVPIGGADGDEDRLLARALVLGGDVSGEDGSSAARVAARAVEVYRAMRGRPDLAALLSAGEALYEVPFSLRQGDRIIRGSIDGLIVPETGPIVVIEFKTGRPMPEHEAQVSIYREALAAAWPGRAV